MALRRERASAEVPGSGCGGSRVSSARATHSAAPHTPGSPVYVCLYRRRPPISAVELSRKSIPNHAAWRPDAARLLDGVRGHCPLGRLLGSDLRPKVRRQPPSGPPHGACSGHCPCGCHTDVTSHLRNLPPSSLVMGSVVGVYCPISHTMNGLFMGKLGGQQHRNSTPVSSFHAHRAELRAPPPKTHPTPAPHSIRRRRSAVCSGHRNVRYGLPPHLPPCRHPHRAATTAKLPPPGHPDDDPTFDHLAS